MQYPLIVPRTSDGALKVTVLKWYKSVGEDVRKGDDLVETKTEKITIYITVPENGKLTQILKAAGEIVDVGEVVGYVEG